MSDLFAPFHQNSTEDTNIERNAPSDLLHNNIAELSVGDLAKRLRQLVEMQFDYVRVRGEISGCKRAASGHIYFTLKDNEAVLDAVCWRTQAGKLTVQPMDGVEVIATGKLTTYPARSRYQIIVERIELAGEGALLKMLELRKKNLTEEGLFDEAKKLPIPTMPRHIIVITSPTGAVIRDLIHRLQDRMPVHLQILPVPVQGEHAAKKIASAILSINTLKQELKPDLVIVARGGGSLEDLWAFNEEVVVRAASICEVPIISAIGHETDVTLLDFVADRRAPTPSAAGEMAVPVLNDLKASFFNLNTRCSLAFDRLLSYKKQTITTFARSLANPQLYLGRVWQIYDDLQERFQLTFHNHIDRTTLRLAHANTRLIKPKTLLKIQYTRLHHLNHQMLQTTQTLYATKNSKLQQLAIPHHMQEIRVRHLGELLQGYSARKFKAWTNQFTTLQQKINNQSQILESLSYQSVLKRGFALLRNEKGQIMRTPEQVQQHDYVNAQLQDGTIALMPAPDNQCNNNNLNRSNLEKQHQKKEQTTLTSQDDLFHD